ncbi:MAG: extracellular solute-binding protein [Limnochordaceae bacterium]|nr:extracellular solute-binding protein [Limnochordaceae bacterium]
MKLRCKVTSVVVANLLMVATVAGFCLNVFPPATSTGMALAAAHKPVTIRFWNWWDASREPLMNEVIRRFQEKYPWITVKSQVDGWSGRTAKVLAAYAAGAPADLTMVTRAELASLADLGAITPITDWVKRDKLDLTQFFAAEVEAFYWDGQLWSLPLPTVSGEGSMYYYNKDLFERAGLDPDHPPLTWRAFAETARKLTLRDDTGRIRQLGMDTFPQLWVHLLYSNGGELLSSDRRHVQADTERGREALRYAVDLTQKLLGGSAAMGQFLAGTTPAIAFAQGRQAIVQGHPSVMAVILQNAPAGFRWGVMPAPYNDQRPEAKSRGIAGFQWGWGYAIPKGLPPEREEAAWLFLKFITADEQGAGYFLVKQGRPASVIRFNLNPEYSKIVGPNWPLIIKYLGNDVAFPALPVMGDIFNKLVERSYAPMGGTVEPDNALQGIQTDLQRIVDDYWAKRNKS